MDQRKKDLLNSTSPDLAEILNFNEVSELLLLAGLVSKERMREITATVDSNFSRNLKLLDAVQESRSAVAFDEFVRILEITNNSKALQLLSTTRGKPGSGTGRSILNKLAIKFGRSKSPAYPMGLKSGYSLDKGAQSEQRNCSFSPPMSPSSQQQKAPEKTLSYIDREDNSGFAERSEDCNKSIPALVKRSLSIGTPPATGSTRSFEKNSFLPTASHTSSTQTPTRVSELKIGSLSLNGRNQEELGGGGEEEPVVVFHPYAAPAQPSANNQDSGAQSPHRCSILTSYASSNESMSSMESLNQMESSFIVKSQSTMAVAHGLKMIVKPATAPKTNLNEVYKMTARPRGICLIVNNIDFIGDIFPTRTGSDIDAKRFDEVFTQLHFHVVMKRNLTAEEMKKTFKEVAKQCHKSHDALFVFILSHGNEQGIYGVDGLEVYLEEDIISCFDNRRCEVMQGKPKVLVIQACRGRNKDYGGGDGDVTDSIIASPESASILDGFLPLSSQSSQASTGAKKRKMAIQTDILLVFSCLHGYVSVRNELAGSWLGTSLSYWIMRMAFKKDFQKILNYVSNDINQRESSTGHIQAIDVQLRGWNKELYFNPGF